MAAGERRPALIAAAVCRRSTPAIFAAGSPAQARPRGGQARPRPLARRLLYDLQRAGHRPGAVRVLERAGYAVGLAELICCGRPMISKGFLRADADAGSEPGAGLARRLADGTPILGLEPSCLLTLADEWTELVPRSGQAPHRRGRAPGRRLAREADSEGRGCLCGRDLERNACLHGHCHQKALVGVGGTAAALRLVPGLDVTVLDTGCCGMAGSFGYEKEHYDLSVKIAELTLLPALAAAPECHRGRAGNILPASNQRPGGAASAASVGSPGRADTPE